MELEIFREDMVPLFDFNFNGQVSYVSSVRHMHLRLGHWLDIWITDSLQLKYLECSAGIRS